VVSLFSPKDRAMKSLQALFVTLLLCSSLAVQATENGSGDPRYTIQNPPPTP
jgi:hypothetical protein